MLSTLLAPTQLASGAAMPAAVGRLITMSPHTDLAERIAEADLP